MRAIALMICLALPLPGLAQDVVGLTVLGGKRVELLSDNTWRFAETPQARAECVPINMDISFCGTLFDWRPQRPQGDFLRVFRHDDRNYAGVIYETIGEADGIDLDVLRAAALDGVSYETGVPVEEIPVLSVTDTMVDDVLAETMTYGFRLSGLDVVYQNTMIVTETRAIQFILWTISDDLTPEMEALNDAWLGAIELDLPENRL